MRLNHGIDQDGDPADCFDYHDDDATCPVFTVNGREVCARVDPDSVSGPGETMRLNANVDHMHLIDPKTDAVL